ncbi:MAG: hypothetical protein HQK57_00090 [Deltaproteobacteria bacterium]|nr:hypothetical protein [Deltaproteobacteria bacterium]
MDMLMRFYLVGWMVVVVLPVITRVVMTVNAGNAAMGMLVKMFVQVLMGMAVVVFMAVHHVPVRVFVGMKMFVLVCSFHCSSSCSSGYGDPSWVH